MVAARPRPDGSWEIALVRHGRLAGTSVVPSGVDPRPWVDALVATGEVVPPGPGPLPASSAEETECLLRWLDSPGRPPRPPRGHLGLPRPRRGRSS